MTHRHSNILTTSHLLPILVTMVRDKVSEKVTNQSVGDALGIDQSYVSLIRRGLRVPSRDVVVTLARVYEVNQAELMTAYTSEDPHDFAACFNRVVGFPALEVEPVESDSR